LPGTPEASLGESGKIGSLRNRLKTGSATGQIYTKTLRERQDRIVREWTNDNNLPVIPESDFLAKWNIDKIKGGENRVYFQDNYAYKLNNLIYHDFSVHDFADRLIQSNNYFHDTAIDITGFALTSQGLRPLLRQKTVVVKDNVFSTKQSIRAELEHIGFKLIDLSGSRRIRDTFYPMLAQTMCCLMNTEYCVLSM